MAIFATETKLTFWGMDQVFELIEIAESYIRKNIKWPVNFKSGSMERVGSDRKGYWKILK